MSVISAGAYPRKMQDIRRKEFSNHTRTVYVDVKLKKISFHCPKGTEIANIITGFVSVQDLFWIRETSV